MIKTNAKVGAWLNDWQMNKCKVVVLVKDCDAPDARGMLLIGITGQTNPFAKLPSRKSGKP